MNWHYAYTPYLLPMLASAMFLSALGIYAWQRRTVSGALPFAVMLLFTMLWSLGAALELAAVDLETKIFWFKFRSIMKLPAATAELCFGLQYASLGRFLTRRNLTLLSIPPLLVFVLTLTNNIHHLLWLGFGFDGVLRPLRSNLTFAVAGYSYVLALAILVFFIQLFLRSPQHRWPVALILSELLIARTAVLLDFIGMNPFAPMDPVVLVWNIGALMYALALFGFRMFDPIPLARQTAISQMRDGMLVLDGQGRVVSLNPAAEQILGAPAKQIKGRRAGELLPACPNIQRTEEAEIEIDLPGGHGVRHYTLAISPLKDWSGLEIGRLLLLHNVTAQKRAQTQLLEQQKVVAALHEREQLAHELHDSLGQMLGYISMQAQAIRKRAHNGSGESVESQLTRLAEVAQEAHKDIRESIFNLKTGPVEGWSFFATLRGHLAGYQEHYGICAELNIPEGLTEDLFEKGATVQLLRVIQEALTNAHKHGQARRVQVSFACDGNQVRIVIADDGCGFDPDPMKKNGEEHFGLAFMRERMKQIGGSLTIKTQPGAGTRVLLCAPIREGRKEAPG